jgi:hypothetical protein
LFAAPSNRLGLVNGAGRPYAAPGAFSNRFSDTLGFGSISFSCHRKLRAEVCGYMLWGDVIMRSFFYCVDSNNSQHLR